MYDRIFYETRDNEICYNFHGLEKTHACEQKICWKNKILVLKIPKT